jgi:hypothetical protein
MTTTQPSQTVPIAQPGWGTDCCAAICERCDRSYLVPEQIAAAAPMRCPLCFQATLTRLPETHADARFAHPPEITVPFELPEAALERAFQQFAERIPYAPADLSTKTLRGRVQAIFLPVWLVDAHAQAEWAAEAGYNYQVVSHRDQYHGAGWSSQQVQEQRIRWEPRLGRLTRAYTNIPAPALEDHRRVNEQLGKYTLTRGQPYQPEALAGALLRAPERTPQDAWSDARPALEAAAAEECRQACGADHLRQFSWQPRFDAENWTLMLLPMFSTFYQDDEGAPQPVWVNAQTGQVSGKRRASPARAMRQAGIFLGVAVIIFLLSLALLAASLALPLLAAVSILGFTAAVLTGLAAIFPIFRTWSFNRSQANS